MNQAMSSVLLLSLFLVPSTRAQEASYVLFNAPNATQMDVTGINNSGNITGDFLDTTGNYHGFVRDQVGTLTVFDIPDASGSVPAFPASINAAGDVLGFFFKTTEGITFSHGFLRDRLGNVTVFDAPNAIDTTPTSINNSGTITGTFRDDRNTVLSHSFVRDSQGNFTVFDATTTTRNTQAISINDKADIAGYFGSSSTTGFIRDSRGNFTFFQAPNALVTASQSINNRGDVAGFIQDVSAGYNLRGFVCDRLGKMTVFDASPNASSTIPYSINDRGDVTGYFVDAADGLYHGFLRTRREILRSLMLLDCTRQLLVLTTAVILSVRLRTRTAV